MKYSEVIERLQKRPHVKLGFFPTPFYKLENLSRELGVELYIKRDDFTGMNLFGGNKIRKLEYLIGDAVESGAEYVFTYGATQSNHAMQTVTACRRCGLKPILYLTAIVEPKEDDVRANLLLDKVMGAEIHIVSIRPGETEDEAEERSYAMGREHIARLEAEGKRCCNVPMGGASHIGSAAFIGGYAELQGQLEDSGIEADYVFHATGSGGTMAGIVAGHKLVGSSAKVVSVAVSDHPLEQYLREKCALANESLKWAGFDERVSESDFFVDRNYFAPGYERPSKAASEAIKLLAMKEGLFADPVYSGKCLSGLLDYVRSGKIAQGSRVVFWHTGGATALFAEKEILGDLF
jgi:L-cysteate sulfo-lyase